MLNPNSYGQELQMPDFQNEMNPYPGSPDQLQFMNSAANSGGYVPNMVRFICYSYERLAAVSIFSNHKFNNNTTTPNHYTPSTDIPNKPPVTNLPNNLSTNTPYVNKLSNSTNK